jgi:hypothetical protein
VSAAAPPLPATPARVVVTAGRGAAFDGGTRKVAKPGLVGTSQTLAQSRRPHVAAGLPLARVLAEEMATFRVKVTAAGNETFDSWRERDHPGPEARSSQGPAEGGGPASRRCSAASSGRPTRS